MSLQEQLLIGALNQLRVLTWQNTEDGQKGRNAPEPIPTPSDIVAQAEEADRNAERARALRARLARRRQVSSEHG